MKRALLLLVLALAQGCSVMPRSGGYYEDDGPHARPPDVSRIPDAVPRHELPSASGNRPYTVFNKTYYPLRDARGYSERGVASWYGKKFHGRRTSSGEPYDMYAMTAAHKTLPLPSYVRVRNLQNGRSVIVRVNDRGPFLHNRLIDLSYAAASRLGYIGRGTALVEIEVVSPDDKPLLHASERQPPADATSAQPRIFVQAGAFASRDNAQQLQARLERAGLTPARVSAQTAEGRTLYRVRIGPLDSVEDSDRVIKQAMQQGIEALIALE